MKVKLNFILLNKGSEYNLTIIIVPFKLAKGVRAPYKQMKEKVQT